MAEQAVLHIGENSPEEVAHKLFMQIASVEQKSVSMHDAGQLKAGWSKADREYILQTYAQCLNTVRSAYYG